MWIIAKLKFKSQILKSIFFHKLFYELFYRFFCHIYKSVERYQNLSEKEKEKKQQYGRERHKNLSENEKQKLFEYRKNYYGTKRNYYNVEYLGSF